MNRTVLLAVVLACGAAGVASAQTETSQQGTRSETSTVPSPDASGERPAGMPPAPDATKDPNGEPSIVGAKVETPTGEKIASIADVVLDEDGEPSYILITDQKGEMTAMPYSAASGMLEDDVLVVERAKFDAAPKLKQGALAERSITTVWQDAADSYWGRGSIRTASPSDKPRDRG